VVEDMKTIHKWTDEEIEANIFQRYCKDSINGNTYDPTSIMHYSFPATWIKSGKVPPRNTKLSIYDKQLASKIYPQSFNYLLWLPAGLLFGVIAWRSKPFLSSFYN